jgi:hypothetical protein
MPNLSAASLIAANPIASTASSLDEARILVQRCAEPRPVGDSAKAAINRAAKRLGFSHNRTKDMWYRAARRIHSYEMDRLRRCAANADLEQAVAGLKLLRSRLAMMSSPKCRELIDAIDAALGPTERGRVDPRSATG